MKSRKLSSLLLCIILIISLIPIEAGATQRKGTDSSSSGASGAGTWCDDQVGYRIAIVDKDGTVVGNKVDIVFSNPTIKIKSGQGSCWGWAKVEGWHGENTDEIGKDPLDMMLKSNVKIIHINQLTGFNGNIPKILWVEGNDIKADGKRWNDWFMKGMDSIDGSWTTKNTSKTTASNTSSKSSQPQQDKVILDACSRLEKNMVSNFEFHLAAGNNYDYSVYCAYQQALETISKWKDLGKFTDKQCEVMKASVEDVRAKLLSEKPNNLPNPFLISYAESNEDEKDTEKSNIARLMNYSLGESQIFNISSYENRKLTYIYDEDGTVDVLDTCTENNLRITVEPLIWMIPESVNRIKAYPKWFYGTPTNWAQFLVIENRKGVFSDGNGKGGNYKNTINRKLAHSLYLKYEQHEKPGRDDNLYDLNFANADNPNYNHRIVGVVPKEFQDKSIAISNGNLADITQGYAINWYYGKDDSSTHTWDNKNYPDKYNYKEGKAPDEQNKSKYNIIKFYEEKEEFEDGTTEIRHISTHERLQTYPKIKIQDELVGGYKVVEWKWSPDPKPEITTNTKWTDPVITAINATESGTEATDPNYIDITKKNEDGTDDKDTVTTLYVRLQKEIVPPTTSTWDNKNYTSGDPGPAPDPTKDTDNPVGPGNPNLKYRIIKVYEELERGRPESEIETISTLLREPTIPRIHIDDEPQYKLIEWKYGTPNNPVTSPTESWAEVTSGVSNTHSGTSETTVNLFDPSNPDQAVTLYVRLRKTIIPPPEPINEDLTESQLIKISNSNSTTFGWNSNIFTADIEAAITTHDFIVHVGPCGKCGFPPGSGCTEHCGDYTSSHSMSREKGDPVVSATFAILTKDNHETTVATPSAHSDFAGKTWGKETEVDDSIKYEKTIGDDAYSWSLTSDGSSEDGVEYITTLSRASIQDIANIALYKKDAMSKDSYDRVNTVFPEANTYQNRRKGNGTYSNKLSYVFGHSVFDNSATSSCGLGNPDHHGLRSKYDDIKFVTYNIQKLNLDGNFNIYVYGGKKTKDAKATSIIQSTGFTVVHGSNATNITNNGEPKTALYHSQQTATIKFFPYVRMSYMTTLDNKEFTNYSSFEGYTRDPSQSNSRTVYMLSTKQSTITPTNAVEVSWDNQAQMSGKYGLQMTSQQWSTHASATSGKDWRQKTQVLPGGALYQLKTNNTESTIKTVTYNTLVEDSSRAWISVSDNNKYTIPSIIKSTQDYLTEAENVIENYRIVQWVNKDWSVSNAWDNASSQAVKIKTGGESLSNLGMSTTASTDSKYLLINGTSKNDNIAEADIDIIGKNYATKVCKGFTDTDGNVYIAYVIIEGSQEKLSESSLNTAVNYLKSVCGTEKTPKTTLPSNMSYDQIMIGKKQYTAETIINNLKTSNNELYQMEIKTGWISNLINSVERNTGNDKNATWLSVQDGKWYNEAFDGYYIVMQQAYYKVGINIPKVRQSVLDPKLCPIKTSTSDIFSKAYVSQFRLDEKSTVAEDKEDGYLATFEDMTVIIPNLPIMFISRPFYIPNANVQDLT